MSGRILFLVPYPLREAPSQRFRFEQYFETLLSNGYTTTVQSFFPAGGWRVFYRPGNLFNKLKMLAHGVLKRLQILSTVGAYDFVFIHREALPFGPPILEWIISRILKVKIIYDFDDAIWLTDEGNEGVLKRWIKSRSKAALICKFSYRVSCGNEYLRHYASQFNFNAIFNPTTIDTDNRHNPEFIPPRVNIANNINIGWTGSHSTLKYLKTIENVLQDILQDYPNISVVVIADKKPELTFPFTFLPWNEKTEISDLSTIDIGIMPLPDDEWTKGKCGFKALQYMALKKPVVASPVGVNTTIITDGVNGFLANGELEWFNALERLIENPLLRQQMGEQGRKTVVSHYSVASNSTNFLSLFA